MSNQSKTTGKPELVVVPKTRTIRETTDTYYSVAMPVGSVFIGNVSTNPGTLFGFGTWTAVNSGIWIIIDSVNLYIWQRTA